MIAIHAAKVFPRWAVEMYRDEPALRRALLRGGFQIHDELPRGAVIATARLIDLFPDGKIVGTRLSKREQAFGDYGQGRWAWHLVDDELLVEPVPAPGALGLWDWSP